MKGRQESGIHWPERLFEAVAAHDLEVIEHAPPGLVRSAFWTRAMFARDAGDRALGTERLVIIRSGLPVLAFNLRDLPPEAVVGRHPSAAIQLEAHRMGMFQACLWRFDDEFYIEALDADGQTLLNRKPLTPKEPVPLNDGAVVEIPGHQLLFTLPETPAGTERVTAPSPSEPAPDSARITPHDALPPDLLLAKLIESPERPPLWTAGTISLRVVDILDETPDTRTFRLVGENPTLFSYRPGQFVSLLLDIGGRAVQRSYSLSSSPSRPWALEVTVKRIPGGLVSNWLCDELRVGDVLRAKGPAGHFSCCDHPARKLLFIAAGSGITPLMAMCRWIVDTAAAVDVQLLASFRTPADIVFRRELEWMTTRHPAFRVALTLTATHRGAEDWTGLRGRITADMLSLVSPDYLEREVFLCGPEPFMAAARAALQQLGADPAALHQESFGVNQVASGVGPATTTPQLNETRHRVIFSQSGLTVEVDEHMSLLELGEANGIAIDYNCRSGTCGECEVKCAGTVAISPSCEIDERSRAAGFVWACSCTARSDLVVDA